MFNFFGKTHFSPGARRGQCRSGKYLAGKRTHQHIIVIKNEGTKQNGRGRRLRRKMGDKTMLDNGGKVTRNAPNGHGRGLHAGDERRIRFNFIFSNKATNSIFAPRIKRSRTSATTPTATPAPSCPQTHLGSRGPPTERRLI